MKCPHCETEIETPQDKWRRLNRERYLEKNRLAARRRRKEKKEREKEMERDDA